MKKTILLSRLIYSNAWESSSQDRQLYFPYFGTSSALKCVCDGSAAKNSTQEPRLRLTPCYFFSRLKYSGQKNGLVFPCTLQFYELVFMMSLGTAKFLRVIFLWIFPIFCYIKMCWMLTLGQSECCQWPLGLLLKLQDHDVKRPWMISEDDCDKKVCTGKVSQGWLAGKNTCHRYDGFLTTSMAIIRPAAVSKHPRHYLPSSLGIPCSYEVWAPTGGEKR